MTWVGEGFQFDNIRSETRKAKNIEKHSSIVMTYKRHIAKCTLKFRREFVNTLYRILIYNNSYKKSDYKINSHKIVSSYKISKH